LEEDGYDPMGGHNYTLEGVNMRGKLKKEKRGGGSVKGVTCVKWTFK